MGEKRKFENWKLNYNIFKTQGVDKNGGLGKHSNKHKKRDMAGK